MTAYRIANEQEKKKAGVSKGYDLLIGPNDFECFLGEPEDCTWRRDGRKVVDELNRLFDLLEEKK